VAKAAGREQFMRVLVEMIEPSKWNPRRIDEKSHAFKDFVADVKGNGVLVPLALRQRYTKESETDGFEILFGERRWRAAKAAGIAEVPAVVHYELSDADAFEITFKENFDREDLSALEEGRAVATLLERFGGDHAAVAAKLGRPERWVRMREGIQKNLSKAWVKALAGDGPIASYTAGHLVLIARLPHESQDQILQQLWNRENGSIADLEEECERVLMALSRAPWKKDQPIADLPACVGCQKCSTAQPGLWDDGPKGEDSRCLDPECFQAKLAAHLKAAAAAAKQKYPKLEYVYRDGMAAGEQAAAKAAGLPCNEYAYRFAKKNEAGARPAFVVAGKGAGTVVWLKPAEHTGGQKTVEGPKTLKQKREELRRKRWAEVLDRVVAAVEEAPVAKIASNSPLFKAAALAVVFGIEPIAEGPDFECAQKVFGGGLDALIEALWLGVRDRLAGNLRESVQYEPKAKTSDDSIELAKETAAVIGLDANAIFQDVSGEKGFLEPKAWAQEDKPPGQQKDTKDTKHTKPTPPAPALDPALDAALDEAVRMATSQVEGAAERWAKLKTGGTNEAIRMLVKNEMSSMGGSSRPAAKGENAGWDVSWKGGELSLSEWPGMPVGFKPVTIKGGEVIRRARKIWGLAGTEPPVGTYRTKKQARQQSRTPGKACKTACASVGGNAECKDCGFAGKATQRRGAAKAKPVDDDPNDGDGEDEE
jgi:ParB family chromosome partitioning protein